MKNIFQLIEKYQKLIIVLITMISIVYFGYGIFSIILNHISVSDADIVTPNFDTISSYFKL
jgi:hypothetical protein